MTEPRIQPGDIVDLHLRGDGLQSPQKRSIVRTGDVEIIQFVIPAGAVLPTHEAQGEIVLQCLQGHVEVTGLGLQRQLEAGNLLYFAVNEPFSIRGIQDASILALIIVPKQGPAVELVGT